ncbi:uncharacterized protein LOC133303559 [Gastrolobium bilobum]|uniref:uncharacterized protein LOC133303559 n=1 Tax=Gastrolobium bilobum TaxID=150636 RepID=UPI002AB1787E|nr:uncharacterized protein LOC133303559 [Gastrolobium bilobum]
MVVMISKRVSLKAIALAIVLISFNVGSVAAYDPYHTPDPSPPPYEYICYDWKFGFENSHNKKPLLGATVEVACKAEGKTIKAYGKTKSNGQYIIKVEDFDYLKYGPTVCEAKLHAPPKESSCNKPTKLGEGTDLKVIYHDNYEVVLEAKPFAYAKNEPYEECEKSRPPSPYPYISPPPSSSPSPLPYPYISPPPPPSPYSPPPSSSPSPPPYPYISPPPPPSPYSPPPPSPYSPPPYPYISPPPPSPSPPPYHNK